jgi:hypothetical protein
MYKIFVSFTNEVAIQKRLIIIAQANESDNYLILTANWKIVQTANEAMLKNWYF